MQEIKTNKNCVSCEVDFIDIYISTVISYFVCSIRSMPLYIINIHIFTPTHLNLLPPPSPEVM